MRKAAIVSIASLLIPAAAGSANAQTTGSSGTANPVVLVIVLGALALAPFALIMLTSFV